MQQVVSINPDVKPDAVAAGQTILLPAGTLSARDRWARGTAAAATSDACKQLPAVMLHDL